MRKRRVLPLLALLLAILSAGAPLPAAAQAQPQAEPQPDADPRCQRLACRKPGASTMRLREGGSITLPRPPAPYFSGSVLSLVPGETVVLGFSRTAEGGLSAPVLLQVSDAAGVVDTGLGPDADMTLSFSFRQQDGKPDMMLTVVNKTHMMIKYDAFMYVPNTGNVRGNGTSSCPVMPALSPAQGFSTFESWPHPIALLLIGRIRVLTPDATAICN
jgi:hypothetical protein